MNYGQLITEGRNQASLDLDQLSSQDAVRLMNRMDREIPDAVERAIPEIAATIDAAVASLQRGGRIIYCGAGTSGRLGVLDASECLPTFGISPDIVIGRIAGGDTALRYAVEGAEDDAALGAGDMAELNVCDKDLVIALSASGTAAYCTGALRYAREHGASTAGVTCVESPVYKEYCDRVISVVVGPEVLTGSTRLRSGTATKMVLNMISTIAMVRIGKVYKNLMVDVVPTNIKLRDRAVRITMAACEITREEAEALLDSCGGNIKTAIVCHITGTQPDEAVKALDESGGMVRDAVRLLIDKG